MTAAGRSLERSQGLLERARRVIPSATQTFSKGPNQWARGVSPHFLDRAAGAWVWDADGNRYLDYLMALGPVILGYGDPAVDGAIRAQLERGIVFSQMNALEVEVAERLVELIPCADMVRFGKNGSDVTSAAVRAARAMTSRDHVAVCGYHGWQDWFIGTTTRSRGVPAAVAELATPFTYNDIASLHAVFDRLPDQVAAVVMEPVGVEPPQADFLSAVRELCTAKGALLVFDEIITGFRLGLGGAQAHFGVTPDLACFGKAMANGMPLSAVVGRREVMEIFDEIFFSGTFGGEALSLAACAATLERLVVDDVLTHVWTFGDELIHGLSQAISDNGLDDDLRVLGYGPRSVMAFPGCGEDEARARRTLLMQECVKRGLLYFGSHLPTGAHGRAELDFTLSVFAEALPTVAAAIHSDAVATYLEGPPVDAIFRRA
jgi:glutamate-1-semialdehyde aminotransferase